EEPGSDDLVVLRGAVAPYEVEEDRQEVGGRADQGHDRDQHVPARLRHADELRDGRLRVVEDVAQRATEADGYVERAVLPLREVEHVRDGALDDAMLEPLRGDARLVQRQLSG